MKSAYTYTLYLFMGVLLVASFVFGMVVYEKYYPTPKYKVGDCIAEVHEAGEFISRSISKYPDLIIAVGEVNYLICGNYDYDYDKDDVQCAGAIGEYSIRYINTYTLVSCKTGEEL